MDFISLSKILPLLIFPVNLVFGLLLTALLFMLLRKYRWCGGCIVAAAVIIMVGGNPAFSRSLFMAHENRFSPLAPDAYPEADVIVVLGGGLGLPLPPRTEIDLTSATDRLWHAVQLFRAGRADTILLTGGNVFPQAEAKSESYFSGGLLQEWGVPESQIVLEENSRNTYENALHTRKILQTLGMNKVLLVTSALHMPRALAVFQSVGIDAIPAPTDFNIVKSNYPAALDWIPSIEAMSLLTQVLREKLGILVYRWRGWIKDNGSDHKP